MARHQERPQKGDLRAIHVPRERNPRNQQARVDRLKARMALAGWRYTHADMGDGGRPITLHFENLGRSRFWWVGVGAGVAAVVAFCVAAVLAISYVSWALHQPDVEPAPPLAPPARAAALTAFRAELKAESLARYVTDVVYDPKLEDKVPEAVLIRLGAQWETITKGERLRAARGMWDAWRRQNTHQSDPDRIRIRLVNHKGKVVGGSRWLGGSVVDVD